MRARYQEFLSLIEMATLNASDDVAYEKVISDSTFLGIASNIEISGVRAMCPGVVRGTPKNSPSKRPAVYAFLRKRTLDLISKA